MYLFVCVHTSLCFLSFAHSTIVYCCAIDAAPLSHDYTWVIKETHRHSFNANLLFDKIFSVTRNQFRIYIKYFSLDVSSLSNWITHALQLKTQVNKNWKSSDKMCTIEGACLPLVILRPQNNKRASNSQLWNHSYMHRYWKRQQIQWKLHSFRANIVDLLIIWVGKRKNPQCNQELHQQQAMNLWSTFRNFGFILSLYCTFSVQQNPLHFVLLRREFYLT